MGKAGSTATRPDRATFARMREEIGVEIGEGGVVFVVPTIGVKGWRFGVDVRPIEAVLTIFVIWSAVSIGMIDFLRFEVIILIEISSPGFAAEVKFLVVTVLMVINRMAQDRAGDRMLPAGCTGCRVR